MVLFVQEKSIRQMDNRINPFERGTEKNECYENLRLKTSLEKYVWR